MASEEDMRNQIAQGLRKLRESTGSSRAFMADSMGVDIKTYARYEDGASDPSFVQLMSVYDALNTDFMPTFMKATHPDLYDVSNAPSTPEIRRRAVVYYMQHGASDYQIDCIYFICDAKHGSDVSAVLTGEVMNMQSTMEYRLLLAQNNLMHYKLCKAQGLLLFEGEIKPDVEAYEAATLRGREAVLAGRNSYSTIKDTVLSKFDK